MRWRSLRIALALAALLAVVVAVGWWSGRQPPRDAVAAAERELGVSLEVRRVDVGEVTLQVVLAGPDDGAPVLLLHGFPEFWYAWRGPLAVLARAGFRVIVPDQRGYDASDKPADVASYRIDRLAGDVANLITALGYDDAFVAAHDWGGGVAWHLALAHPERVRRLAVIDTPHPQAGEGFTSEEETVSWYRSFLQLPWLPEWTARVGNWRILSGSLRDSAEPGTFPDEVLDLYRSAWYRDGAFRTMANWYRAAFREPFHWEGEQRVRVPTVVVVAPDDPFIPSDLTRRSLRYLDDGRLVELERGTHWVIQEDPQTIGALLVDFFREPDAGAAPDPEHRR